MPDQTLALIQAGLLLGKSVGFLRLKSHAPSSHEIAANPDLAQVTRTIDAWLLLEYACTFLPCNQAALVQEASAAFLTWSSRPPAWNCRRRSSYRRRSCIR
jgi:hypothetical protein